MHVRRGVLATFGSLDVQVYQLFDVSPDSSGYSAADDLRQSTNSQAPIGNGWLVEAINHVAVPQGAPGAKEGAANVGGQASKLVAAGLAELDDIKLALKGIVDLRRVD